jgi:hypothetical protein
MRVTRGEHTDLEAPAKAEAAADDVIMADYYTRSPQIRLTGHSPGRPIRAQAPTEIVLDGNDVAQLVECAIRHPTANIRYAVLAAIWNHPDSFRQIFRFGLEALVGFPEIRKIVAEELAKCSGKPEFSTLNRVEPAGETLLPRMPLPAHLRDRERR